MPSTAAGRQKFLNYWLYGVLKAAEELGNDRVLMRTIEQHTLTKFFAMEGVETLRSRDALSACKEYSEGLDARGIMDAHDTSFRADGNRVLATIGPLCPYRDTCTWIYGEGGRVHCFRGVAFAEMLRLTLKRDFQSSLDAFGVPCEVTIRPQLPEARSHGN